MKRIALIVTGTALLVASCGLASAASKTEVTMPNRVIVPLPAELESKGLMLTPNLAYQLLNPVSPEQRVAKAEAQKHLTRPQYMVSPEQQVAKAEAQKHLTRPQYMVSPEQQVAKAEAQKHLTRPQYMVSPEQQVAKAEAQKHLTRPQYMVSPEQQVAKAEAQKHLTRPQYMVSPEQQVAKAEAQKHLTQAPTGFGGCPPDDRPCSGNGPLRLAAQNT